MICSRCIMDTTVPGIWFDENGVCNFCKIHDTLEEQFPLGETGRKRLEQLIEKIKNSARGKEYDCVVGVSGGMDSTYVLYTIVSLGLKPLAVHMDNGWNTELSVHNIEKATRKLGVDLHTVVLDWEEFKDIQIAFLKASVPDVEMPTDWAIRCVLYRIASKQGLKYVVDGQCFRTGGKCPIGWNYGDGKYLKAVHEKFGKVKMKTFPNLTIWEELYYNFVKGIRFVHPLYYVEYNVEGVKKLLKKELGWKPYPAKHFESVYTRFIQSYLLPKKFNIDKRKIHFSALIRSGQMTREEALKRIKKPPFSPKKMEEDRKYVIKKLGLTQEEFERIMRLPPKSFLDYPNNFRLKRLLVKIGYKIGLLSKKHRFYTWDTIKK